MRDILLADRPHDGADRGPTDPPVTADQMGTDRHDDPGVPTQHQPADGLPSTAGMPTGTPDGAPASASGAAPVDDVTGMKTARTGGVVRAGAVMAVATLFSRITGFLSKVVLLSVLGSGIVNDAYTLANTLPNIIFELLIGGVLTSVAIPLLSRARSDPDGGSGYTQRLITVALVGLLVATVLAVAGRTAADQAVPVVDDSPVDLGLANNLAYLLLPQIFFYGIAALFGAILNTKEKFGVPAWAPVANNVVVIGVGVVLLLDAAAATAPPAAR